MERKPVTSNNVHAHWVGRGRVWVEEIDLSKGTARVRFDCAEGTRSRVHVAPVADLDHTSDGWKRNAWN